jgi:hypothetical protein
MRDAITSDHVIESYLLTIESRPQWSHRYVLARFLRRWPEHATALLEHVALEAIISTAPESAPDPEAEERIVQRGMEIVRKLLERRRENKFAHSEKSY